MIQQVRMSGQSLGWLMEKQVRVRNVLCGINYLWPLVLPSCQLQVCQATVPGHVVGQLAGTVQLQCVAIKTGAQKCRDRRY